MHLSEALVGAVVTVGTVAASYVAFDPGDLARRAETVAGKADCRAVDQAVLGYLIDHDAAPRAIADLQPYVRGDISAYTIVGGLARGPGCA